MSVTQLGRFGDFASRLMNHNYDDRDQQIAHLYASDGLIQYGSIPGARPTVQQVLDDKGLWDQRDPTWTNWRGQFDNIQHHYLGGLRPLQAQCRRGPQPGPPPSQCWHGLIPPLKHYNLRWFVQHVLPNLPNNFVNVAQHANGVLYIQMHSKPLWNFVISQEGEILLSEEDWGVIKHSSLSGGRDVWSAGQIGVANNRIHLVDLHSGHFMKPVPHPTPLSLAFIAFTREVFLAYAGGLLTGIPCLHPGFDCVWF
jgi:hypothetical protein